MRKQLLRFIEHNGFDLDCSDGSEANGIAIQIAGYALHIGIKDITPISTVLNEEGIEPSEEFLRELERVFEYAKNNNYGAWWKDPANKDTVIDMLPPEDRTK